jgi:hypothetical protein
MTRFSTEGGKGSKGDRDQFFHRRVAKETKELGFAVVARFCKVSLCIRYF